MTPGDMNEEQRAQERMRQMRSCQTLNMVALIGAPVSLLVGGLALSVAALVCAIVSHVKLRRLGAQDDASGSVGHALYRQSTVALVASSAIAALNLVAFVYMFGAVLEALRSGELSSLAGSFGSAAQGAPDGGASIWD